MSEAKATPASETPETQICSNCLHEIHRGEPTRYVGKHITHFPERCIQLLRLSTIDLERRLREAQEERERVTVERDRARATNRYYESALYFPGIRPYAVSDGDAAVEVSPQRVSQIIASHQAAESRAEAMEKVLCAIEIKMRKESILTQVEINRLACEALRSAPRTCPHGFDYISCHVCKRAERSGK